LHSRGRMVFRPFSLIYLGILLLALIVFFPIATMFMRELLVSGLGIPPEYVGAFLLVSLVGSYINIPVATIQSRVPMYRLREVVFWGVRWQVPAFDLGVTETHIMMNLGGAVVPVVTSVYLLANSIPWCSPDPLQSYLSVAVVLIMVTLLINRTARVVPGLGIATPTILPPLFTALATIIVDMVSPVSCPTQIAYVGGTLGTLIGADLLNLRRVEGVGAPVVSIGGAGTFDGVYLTGLISVLLVLIL